jgi:hypothetical protein
MAAYARQAVARSGAGWTVAGNTATLAALATFPAMSGGAGGTVTHFGVGTDLTGAGQLIFFGAVTPNLVVAAGVTPKLDTGTVVTQAADGMANAAATAFLNLLFANVDWANVGDAAGLQNSATAGSLYLSLHTSSPAEAGSQSTNEISYT